MFCGSWIVLLFLLLGIIRCDGRGCATGWTAFRESCYLFGHIGGVHFTAAERYCQQHHGSHLVTVGSAAENAFLQNHLNHSSPHLPSSPPDGYWMGLTDEATEGVWVWKKNNQGVAASVKDWGPGEPNNSRNRNEDCAMFANWSGYKWNDAPCTSNYKPLCEKRKTEDPAVG